jgi:hypothetical protein
MKRVLCTVAAIMVATTAFAGTASQKGDDVTPQQAMEKMVNCPVCSVWMTEPAVGASIRHSINPTKTGYVETLLTNNESMMPAFAKTAAECEKRAAGIPSMSQDQKDKLCPICIGQMKLMGRSDVTFENFNTPMGVMMVASSNTPEGLKALHDYAAASKRFGEKMAQAGKEMGKEPMKSKM